MNYRHGFHAGNFADVAKHVLLLQLVRAMQRKEKGFLYLDTHAGAGAYALDSAARGDSLARKPEHPDGIGRLEKLPENEFAALPAAIREYVSHVKNFSGNAGAGKIQNYPGSPMFARLLARPQDRPAFCEKHPEEFLALKHTFSDKEKRVTLYPQDGYVAIRAMLPAPEKRALVFIDPPFEAQNEFEQILAGIREGLRRAPATVFAVWYPMTERADAERFFARIESEKFPPTLTAELTVAGDFSGMKMRGTGLAVINPPWQIESEMRPAINALVPLLAQAPGATGEVRWIVPEK